MFDGAERVAEDRLVAGDQRPAEAGFGGEVIVEARLGDAELRGERSREAAVDVFEDARSRAKIRRDPKYVVGKLGLDRVPHREVGGEIGSSEAVDGLLGIADQEELAGSQATLLPGTGGSVGSGQKK